MDVLLRFSNIKEVEYDKLNVESKSLEILLLGSPKGNMALVKIVSVEVQDWEWLTVMEQTIWTSPGAIIPRTLGCSTLFLQVQIPFFLARW